MYGVVWSFKDFNNGGEFNISTTVYVNVRHWLFWYGVYGFCNKSANDEITIYADEAKSIRLGYFDLMTEPCLAYTLKHELDRVDDEEFTMFSKLSAAWDMHEIERAVKILADDFLHIKVEKIEFLEMPTYEETKVSYERDYAPYAG